MSWNNITLVWVLTLESKIKTLGMDEYYEWLQSKEAIDILPPMVRQRELEASPRHKSNHAKEKG